MLSEIQDSCVSQMQNSIEHMKTDFKTLRTGKVTTQVLDNIRIDYYGTPTALDQVASIIQYDLEYQNLLMCSMRGRAGQIVGQGFSGKKTQLGVKMSKTVKKVGSLNLKTLIEADKLIFSDYEIISDDPITKRIR